MIYAVKDIAVRCDARKASEFKDCAFGSLTQDGHCTYQQIDGGCASPEAYEWIIDQEQTEPNILTEIEGRVTWNR